MARPFVLIQVEDYMISEVTTVGVTDMVTIIVDWDSLHLGDVQAQDLIEEITSRYQNRIDDAGVALVVERIEEIVNTAREEEEEQEEEKEEDPDGTNGFEDSEIDDPAFDRNNPAL